MPEEEEVPVEESHFENYRDKLKDPNINSNFHSILTKIKKLQMKIDKKDVDDFENKLLGYADIHIERVRREPRIPIDKGATPTKNIPPPNIRTKMEEEEPRRKKEDKKKDKKKNKVEKLKEQLKKKVDQERKILQIQKSSASESPASSRSRKTPRNKFIQYVFLFL